MGHAPTLALDRRHQAIRGEIASRGLDALLVTTPPNILYLTNFTGSTACVILTGDTLHFLTDSRYITSVKDNQTTEYACPGLEVTLVAGSYESALASAIASSAGSRVGFEAAHLTVSRFQWLSAALARAGTGKELVSTERIVERARAIKDEHETATLRRAGQLLSDVATQVLAEEIRPGRTESELALAIDWRLRRGGFSRPAFETIVASGPNSALPHARPGRRTLAEGDLVVLDFGGVYDSYCVDLTRTVSIGRAGDRAHEVYAAVRSAHDRAIAAVGPHRSRFAIDAAARDTLTHAGFGEAFGHGTGHGLGIEVHEDPRISPRRPEVDDAVIDEFVVPGMVFTVEPGAYLAGWGGIRIEDDVLVTESGVELLTSVTTELLEI
jgi:Xaa-Pro aminopeptidase